VGGEWKKEKLCESSFFFGGEDKQREGENANLHQQKVKVREDDRKRTEDYRCLFPRLKKNK